MLTWDGYSGENVVDPMASLDGELAMLVDAADEAVGDPDEKRWFARQTRQKQAQKLYRRARPTVLQVVLPNEMRHDAKVCSRCPAALVHCRGLPDLDLRVLLLTQSRDLHPSGKQTPHISAQGRTCTPKSNTCRPLRMLAGARSLHEAELAVHVHGSGAACAQAEAEGKAV